MAILSNVKSLKVRASYSSVVESVSIVNANLDVATRQAQGSDAKIATSVEKCECPPQATGSSCQVCTVS